MIWMIMMCLIPTIPLYFYANSIEQGLQSYVGVSTLILGTFGISLYVWPVRVWRTHLPLRFNRKTRKVYWHWKGTTYIENWDTIRAYLDVQSGLTGVGAPIRDPQVNIEFQTESGKPITVFLMGTDHIGLTVDEKAAAFWEYIRQYMEDGPDNLPSPDLEIWHPVEREDLLKLHWPFPIIRNKNPWFWPIHIFIFFPLRIIWFLITYPTEVLYYHLTKRIKVDPFPPEMEEPCRCEGDHRT